MNAVGLYRVGRWCFNHKIPLIPKLTKSINFLLFNSVIPYTAKIDKETRLAYGGMSVVIHKDAKIGKRVIIGQNVTIGRSLEPEKYPEIGNNVYISAGVRIIGKIVIGNNVIIGANAVVTKDVPDNCIVAGVPAKIIRKVDTDIYALLKNIYEYQEDEKL